MRSLDDERIAHIVKLLERQYRRFLEHELKPHGVMFGHWEILRILWEEEGLSQIELADRAGLSGATVHAALAKMEAKGFIERVVPKKVRSRPVIKLSDLGRSLKHKLVPRAIGINEVATKGLSHDEVQQLRNIMEKMIDNLSEDKIDTVKV